MKDKIQPENAKKQVDKLCDFYDVDMDFVPPDSKEQLKTILMDLEKSVVRGRLEIKGPDDGSSCEPILHLEKESHTFKVLDGAAKVAMSKASTGDNHERIYYLLGYMAGTGPDAIQELKGKYLSTAETLGMFFLQV